MIIRRGPLQARIIDVLAAGKMTVAGLAEALKSGKQQIEGALGGLWARGCIDWVNLNEAQLSAKGREIADARCVNYVACGGDN